MSHIARRFRGVLIALVVLGLSASAVFAAHAIPQVAASVASALTAEHQARPDATETETPDATETPEATDAPEAGDGTDGTNDGTSTDGTTADQAASDAHGELVSKAAHMATPAGFRNHGAFVSCVAQMPAPAAGAPAIDLAALTPADCLPATATDGTATDGTTTTTDQTASDNHGAIVSAAAQMATPAGFRNHGAFVSCIAQMPAPAAGAPALDLTTVTPAMCAGDPTATSPDGTSTDGVAANNGNSGKAHGHGKGHTKHHHS
ncbi:MAG TPA: hypothetical protein VGC90_06025 [Candidatus Limnocylindrales bacterium]